MAKGCRVVGDEKDSRKQNSLGKVSLNIQLAAELRPTFWALCRGGAYTGDAKQKKIWSPILKKFTSRANISKLWPAGTNGLFRRWRIFPQCRRSGFSPWVGRVPGGGNGNTPVFLPEEFHGERSLAGYSPWVHKEWDITEHLTHTHTHTEWTRTGLYYFKRLGKKKTYGK